MSHVVMAESVTLPLSDGSVVEVKKELNAGEYFDLINDLVARKSFGKLLAYIVGWSLVGVDGKPLPYSLDMDEQARRDTVRALRVPTMRELVAVIDRHEAAAERSHEAKKKIPDVSPASNPTSGSVEP